MGRLSVLVAVLLGTALVISPRAPAAPGDLDQTFGNGGRVTTDLGAQDDALAVATQPDGKIVVLASSGPYPGPSGREYVLMQYTSEGTLDETFDGDGIRLLEGLSAEDMVVQPDGKVVVALSDLGLARFNTDGSFDDSFGNQGLATTSCSCQSRAVAMQADGKIVVAGRAEYESEYGDAIVARFNADGTLDTSFASAAEHDMRSFPRGVTLLPMGDQSTTRDVLVKPNGKIVIAGIARVCCLDSNPDYRFGLARLTSDGLRDVSFGENGVVRTRFAGGYYCEAHALALQSDGKVVALGTAQKKKTPSTFAIARYTRGGKLDRTFSGNGKKVTDFDGGSDVGSSVLIQSNGRIIAVGTAGGASVALARYRKDGSLDPMFSRDGKRRVRFFTGSSGEQARHAVLDAAGRILVGGSFALVDDIATANAFDIGLARLLTD